MSDLIVGAGLVLVGEGLLWALAPDLGRRLLERMTTLPPAQVRGAGIVSVLAGLLLVWLVRG